MRTYGKISPTFWTGPTGKAIKKAGRDAQVLALYLQTSPHSNMIGLYYLPIPFICHEVGMSEEGARKALQSLHEEGFCGYDPASEHVWVYEMARYQIGEQLKPTDNQVKGVNSEYNALPKNRFLGEFFDKYQEAYHIQNRRPSEGPSNPLRSQEQEQEQLQEQLQEQEQEQTQYGSSLPATNRAEVQPGPAKPPAKASGYPEAWERVWQKYPKRNGSNPKRDAYRAFNARTKEGVDAEVMEAGVERYAAWCKATGKEGTETVMQGKRFFGPSREFENAWNPPENSNGRSWESVEEKASRAEERRRNRAGNHGG